MTVTCIVCTRAVGAYTRIPPHDCPLPRLADNDSDLVAAVIELRAATGDRLPPSRLIATVRQPQPCPLDELATSPARNDDPSGWTA